MRLEKFELLDRLHAFCGHVEHQLLRDRDDRADDRRVVRIIGDVADEGLVDLEPGDREALEVAQARIPSAEIIERDSHIHPAQHGHGIDRLVGVQHDRAFGQLDLQILSAEAR